MTTVADDVRTWAEIDLDAIRHNIGVVRRRIGSEAEILAVVKADAYGHGVAPVARTLAPEAAIFGVANLKEAREVAALGTGREIMLLSACLPAERRSAVAEKFIVTVSGAEEAAAFADYGPARINFKIDTGMGRIGCPADSAMEALRAVREMRNLEVHSISTHLPSADEDLDFTDWQLGEFAQLKNPIREIFPDAKIHVLNSAGILTRQVERGEIVRPGLMLYGVSPIPALQNELRPALAWKARVAMVREVAKGASISYGRTFIAPQRMRVAVLALGYADGFPRQASGNGASVLLHGKPCPLLGRVTMDQIVVDVSASPEVRAGDSATLVGKDGNHELAATDLAARAGTIAWDVFTGIGQRVRRFHHDSAVS
jgi:alanine racemase